MNPAVRAFISLSVAEFTFKLNSQHSERDKCPGPSWEVMGGSMGK